jgi:hypothetical protein
MSDGPGNETTIASLRAALTRSCDAVAVPHRTVGKSRPPSSRGTPPPNESMWCSIRKSTGPAPLTSHHISDRGPVSRWTVSTTSGPEVESS